MAPRRIAIGLTLGAPRGPRSARAQFSTRTLSSPLVSAVPAARRSSLERALRRATVAATRIMWMGQIAQSDSAMQSYSWLQLGMDSHAITGAPDRAPKRIGSSTKDAGVDSSAERESGRPCEPKTQSCEAGAMRPDRS